MRALLLLFAVLGASSAYAAPQTWLLAVDRWGNQEHRVLTVATTGTTLSGSLDGRPVTGRDDGNRLTFETVDSDGALYRFEATARGDRWTGWADYPDTGNAARVRHTFSAQRLNIPEGPIRRFTYEPTQFSNTFTADLPPALVIRPGDIVSTRTIDSGGVDDRGRVVALYGNPQTGPFFVAGAKSGDVLAVHIRRLSLNRDYADSLDGLTGRAMSLGLAAKAAGLGKRVRWRLDRAAGLAILEDATGHLKEYAVPVRPMLGGLGVAPDFGFPPQSAGDSGRWGGNMDFNEVVEGATVYLPVFQPGAMLFLGDGHALQGDGETTQWALETSLDVEFSVKLLSPRPLASPRIETDRRISVLGQAPSLDEAVRAASSAMVQWLEQDYSLSTAEASLVLGVAAEYRVATLAGRNAGVALSIERSRLPGPKRD
ncbi:acetamidase/formamidase family protein [Caulobacter sp. RL271]|jgi:acetamidase/formamidase|uniref:Acetamidase/formamidase family protein n=1 Tax=Caulobacter segnis TaxID=88688 RepID=A0ABY4ZR70_9CAUL|nr:acetamidase/formamidase family protein [Caulobacter segnis]USQ95206.1 acetamidase/formamidase family protein [Caulobacter segnis]